VLENSRWVLEWRPGTQCTCSRCRHLWQLPPTPSSRPPHAWLPVHDKTQRCFSRCRPHLHEPLAITGSYDSIHYIMMHQTPEDMKTDGVWCLDMWGHVGFVGNASTGSSLLFALWPLGILPELLCAAPVSAFGHCTVQEAAKLKLASLQLTAVCQQYHQASAFDMRSLKTQIANRYCGIAHLRLFKGDPCLRVQRDSFSGSQPEAGRVKILHPIHETPKAHIPARFQPHFEPQTAQVKLLMPIDFCYPKV
jgi:hypothetical protein